jgi:hypothetical protein
MKIILMTIIAILFMTMGTVNAQNINIGAKLGLNSYTLTTGNSSNSDSRIGLHAGLFGHIHLNNEFALQPEILYSMQGAKKGNNQIKLDYINVPVILQYMFDNGFRIQAGPQLGFLISAKAENNSTVDIKDEFKPIDAALSIGVGYIHPPTSFGVDLRYNLGLNDISENAGVKTTNRGLQIGVFYLFNHH